MAIEQELEKHKWLALGGAGLLAFGVLIVYIKKQSDANAANVAQLESAIMSGSLNPNQYSPYSSMGGTGIPQSAYEPIQVGTEPNAPTQQGTSTGSGTPTSSDNGFDALLAALATPPVNDTGEIDALKQQLQSSQNAANAAQQAAAAAKAAQAQAAQLAQQQVAQAQTQSNDLQDVINSTSFNSEVAQAYAQANTPAPTTPGYHYLAGYTGIGGANLAALSAKQQLTAQQIIEGASVGRLVSNPWVQQDSGGGGGGH